MTYERLSKRQLLAMTWWNRPQFQQHDGVICDGSIRSGKTISMAVGFILWAMSNFDGAVFAICGKTIESIRRNVITLLPTWLEGIIQLQERRGTNQLTASVNGRTNQFYLFGGKDESSYALIQGITLSGVLFDEVVLMPESFVNQAMARCSVAGSKFWFNCNPGSPVHWFKKSWIDEAKKKKLLYLHFTMDDNLSLSEDVKQRYKNTFSGIFYKRYVDGLWTIAEGAIYPMFADNPQRYQIARKDLPRLEYINIGVDFGGNKSSHAFVATGLTTDYDMFALRSMLMPAEGVSVESMIHAFIKFAASVERDYGTVDYVYPDCAEQAIINSMDEQTKYTIIPSIKGEIIDRIRATDLLLCENRFRYVMGECESLCEALKTAVWDGKHSLKAVRLDDGSSDIDSLDAFEYSWSGFIRYIIRGG